MTSRRNVNVLHVGPFLLSKIPWVIACWGLSFLLMIVWNKLVHQVRRSTTYIFHFPFHFLQAVLIHRWPLKSPLWSLGNVLHHFTDYHCSATAAVSLSDCYNKTMLHVHRDQCWEILSCALVRPMLPLDCLHQSLLDQHVAKARESLLMGQVVLQPQLCPSIEIMLSHLTEYKNPCLANAVIAVDFDIINPKGVWGGLGGGVSGVLCLFVCGVFVGFGVFWGGFGFFFCGNKYIWMCICSFLYSLL